MLEVDLDAVLPLDNREILGILLTEPEIVEVLPELGVVAGCLVLDHLELIPCQLEGVQVESLALHLPPVLHEQIVLLELVVDVQVEDLIKSVLGNLKL